MTERKPGDTDPNITAATKISGSSSESEGARPYLKVVYPDELIQWFAVDDRPIIIGRDRNADVVLTEKLISRRHCCVTATDEGVLVEDLGSTNGTFINGKKASRALLTVDDRLQIGRYLLRLEFKAPSEIDYDEALLAAATTDPLTGILNRGWFMKRGTAELAAFRDLDTPVSVVMVDIDLFKNVNDSYGHQAGDLVIQGVAQVLAREKRANDLLGRYGGEELVMLLCDGSDDDAAAMAFCERIRRAVDDAVFDYEGVEIKVTISIGVCTRRGSALGSLDEMISEADKALYRAKNLGRNCVIRAF